jgi:hypothetical protein
MTRLQAFSARIATLDGWRRVVFYVAIYLFACAVVIARRPDAILHAQFFAEDGHVWFADAYNFGWWPALFRPQVGYFQTLPRLGAALALLVPFSFAPLVLNVIAVAIQAVPVPVLLSSRSAPWGPLGFRALLAALYLFLPNTRDLSSVVTNSQWILALVALVLLVALPPRSWIARAFDLAVFVLCSLTGPFCIFLLPVAFVLWWGRRQEFWPRVTFAILFFGCVTQICTLLLNSAARPHPVLGASLEWFARLLAGDIYLGTILGGNIFSLRLSTEMIACLAILGTVVLFVSAASAPIGMRCLLLFSALLFAAALVSPTTAPPPGATAWRMLAGVEGARYWFFPGLAFAWSLAYCTRSSARLVRGTAIGLLVLMTVGFVRDFRYPAFVDLSGGYAERLAQTPPGATLTVPINPSGWDMRLVKH